LVVGKTEFADDERPRTDGGVGAVAQLGERLVCNQEATGSIPVSSTRNPFRFIAIRRSRATKHEPRTAKDLMESILGLGGLLVPIVALIVGGVIAVTAMILKHQERLAKIERGIDPDAAEQRK
jgi:hypothetical protein